MAQRTRRIRHFTWAMLVVGIGLIAQASVELLLMRQESWEAAAESGRNLHRTLRERLADLIRRRDAAMLDIIDAVSLPEIASLSSEARHRVFFGRTDHPEIGNGTIIIGPDGDVMASSPIRPGPPINLSARAYFTVHRDNPNLGLHIGEPMRTLRSQTAAIPLSRRLNAPDGRFAGVVVSMISVEKVTSLFADIELGPRGIIALFRDDGTLLARMPPLPAGASAGPLGSVALARAAHEDWQPFVGVSLIDGTRRYYVPGRVPGQPLELQIGRDLSTIQADWHGRAAIVIAAMLGSLMLLVVATGLVEREMRRRRESEAALAASEARYRAILHHASDTIALIEAGGRPCYVSPAVQRLLGVAPEALQGRAMLRLILPECRSEVLHAVRSLWRGAQEVTLSFRARNADGRVICIESILVRSDRGAVVVARDVTAKQAQEATLARLAYQDPLTGLANRRGFDAALTAAWQCCAILRQPLALLLLDIDHFKQLNDTHGHQAGDDALRVVGAKLRCALRRDTDTAARLGGDEMAIILPGMDQAGALALAERLHEALESPPNPPVSTSIGAVAVYPGPDQAAQDLLLAKADAALYRAKRAGRGRVAA